MRANLARQPAQVLRRAVQIIQKAAAVWGGVKIVHQPEFQHYAESFDAVLPTDLLALLVGSAVVADGHFIDAELALGRFHDDLGLEAEALGADRDALEQVGSKYLVARLHVREVQITEHVGDHR